MSCRLLTLTGGLSPCDLGLFQRFQCLLVWVIHRCLQPVLYQAAHAYALTPRLSVKVCQHVTRQSHCRLFSRSFHNFTFPYFVA